jgi:NodT family efflux transporter outer membrane factor (OMF) lipoprotein
MKNIIITVLSMLICLNYISVQAFPKVKPDIKFGCVQVNEKWNSNCPYFPENDPIVKWWEQFNDKQLNDYICDIIKFNYTLQAAGFRIAEARAIRAGANADLFPQVDASVRYSRFQLFGAEFESPLPNVGVSENAYTFETGFDVRWEIDLWGKKRWQVVAAEERIAETAENRRAVMISLVSELARNYMELRGNQASLCNLKLLINLQKKNLQLAETKYQIGLSTKIDVEKERENLASLFAREPEINSAIKASIYAIAVLTGRTPEALVCELQDFKSQPVPLNIVATGLPAEIILRRADIRQAQRNLGVLFAEAGTAQANLYPDIGVNGHIGFQKLKLGDLISLTGGLWSLSPYVNWKIFDRRSLIANLNAKKAQAREADANLRQTVLDALQEVETSIANLEAARNKCIDISRRLDSQKNIFNITVKGFDIGLKSQIDVIETEKKVLEAQDDAIKNQTQINIQTISLYKALGGGWECF